MSSYAWFGMAWMGLTSLVYLFVAVYLLVKMTQGDITLPEALRVWVPLAICYTLCVATNGSLAAIPFSLAGIGYVVWLALQQRAALNESVTEVQERDVKKWRDQVLTDDRNAWAHLSLGSALVECRRYDEAVAHYRKALLQEPKYARDLDLFLAGRKRGEERKLRARLPDLEKVKAQARGKEAPTVGPWRG